MSHPRTSSGRRYTGVRRVLPRLLRLPVALVVAAALVLVLGAGSALGTPEHLTHTWTGAGFDDTWSTFTNWTPEIAPSAADSLVFPAVATSKTSMNDLAPGTPFGSVQIDGSGYTFLGNAIQLDGGITATFASATQEFPLDVALTAPTTMAVDSSSATLTLSGTVSGSSSLTKTGEGTLALTGTPSLTGTLTISAGMLRVDGTTTAPVGVRSGGTLGGTGTVSMVKIADGGACSPGGSSTGILTVASLAMLSGSTLSIQADSATAGTGYDQLRSDGPVALNGATLSVSGSITAGNSVLKIIDVAGASSVSGTFAGLPEGSTVTVNGVDFTLSYAGGDGNDVTLTSGHVPTTFEVSAGDLQSTTVGTAFATALKVRVLDEASDPYPGASVTFTAPASGAGGAFASSSTVTTDGDGYATAPVFTANTLAGSYKVTASTASLTDLTFSLTNRAGSPSSLTAASGNAQTAPVGAAFAARLEAAVKDLYGNPVPGADVTFTAPAGGPSGTFGGSATVTSDGDGIAEAPVFTANGTAGSYAVTASCGGVALPASFNLTNTAAPQITSADSAAFVEGTPGTFTVTATGTPVATLTVTGALPAGVTFADNGDGTATLSGAPAPGTAADYSLTLTAANGAGPDAGQVFTLHVSAPVPPVTTGERRAVRVVAARCEPHVPRRSRAGRTSRRLHGVPARHGSLATR